MTRDILLNDILSDGAPRTKETLLNFHEIMGPEKWDMMVWCLITRHP